MRQAVSAMQVNGGSCDCHRERSKGPWFLLTGKNVFEHRQEPWFLAALGMTAWTYAAQKAKAARRRLLSSLRQSLRHHTRGRLRHRSRRGGRCGLIQYPVMNRE